MKKIILLFIFSINFVTYPQKKQGQALIDSLLIELPKMKEDSLKINLYNSIITEYINSNPEKGIELANKEIELAKKNNWEKGLAMGFEKKARCQISIGEFDDAYKFSQKALTIYLKIGDKKGLSNTYLNFGHIYFSESKLTNALENYLKSLSFAEKINDSFMISNICINLGNVYDEIGEQDKAIELYKKALNGFKTINNKNKMGITHTNIGLVLNKEKKYKLGLQQFLEGLKLSEESKDFNGIAKATANIGWSYYHLENYESAIEYFTKAIGFQKQINDVYGLTYTYLGLGVTYLELCRNKKNNTYLQKAHFYNNKSTIINKKINNLNGLLLNYNALSKIYELENNYKAAFEAKNQSIIYKDSIYNSDNKETIKNLEDKRTIELKEKEIQINKLSLKAKEQQKWYYVSGILFLGILGGLLFYQNKNRKKTNEKLQQLNANLDIKNNELDQANKIKTRFFSILNHDLRGPVSNLIDFLHIQKDAPDLLDEESKKRIETSTIKGAENLLTSMEDMLLWSKGQMENFKPQPKIILASQLFEDTQKVFSGYQKIKFEYLNYDNIEIFTDENYLKTIIRNLTSNAINVFTSTENPTIVWKAWQEKAVSYLSITDNGPGASKEEFKALYDDKEVIGIKSGLGLHLIRDLAKAINCEIIIDSKLDSGTTITLKLTDLPH